ncbi:MAG: 4-(cytidine 5'-diphospho)-2-C-methyl-D-erythritol kinase [Bacteroidetes bacterium]|nr:4-(cytidine 5'-diphospho)-2-C-methyl-D-erythritol kinase [Bacteroidota bacterium]
MSRTYYSYCKINLGLEVLGRRPDGYHDLNTIFYRLDEPFDRFEVDLSDRYSLRVEGSSVPSDNSNLVTRAIRACAEVMGEQMPGLSISLQKRVPVGAGLGGGSANAALAIKIFSDLVAPIPTETQFNIAGSLGADVPFFLLESRMALAGGIGDILTPIEFVLANPIVLVKPLEISINTAEAYRRLDEIGERSNATELVAVLRQPIAEWKYGLRNDFEPIALSIAPQLETLRDDLERSGALFVRISGSGSAFFAIYSSIADAETAVAQQRADPTRAVYLNPGLPVG